ncbi:hypothetical protein [Sandaracinobacter neustonicus]
MFYGAADLETALVEVAEAGGRFAAGTFETLKHVMVLDVRHAPAVPSLFDSVHAKDRAVAQFMQMFITDFGLLSTGSFARTSTTCRHRSSPSSSGRRSSAKTGSRS